MKEIQSLPASVEALMNHARNSLARVEQAERHGDLQVASQHADVALRHLGEAAKIIAQQSPELAALLLLSNMGKSTLTIREEAHSDNTTTDSNYFLGIRTGHTIHRTTNSSSRTRTIKIG